MAQAVNEGAYTFSGRFGEGYYIDPTGIRPPRKLAEATQLSFRQEIAVEDVMLAGNRTGWKDGAIGPCSFTLTLRKIDNFFHNIVRERMDAAGNLALRRALRDGGQRLLDGFTLQVWEDDPDALGAIGNQLETCRLFLDEGGFDFGQTQQTVTFEGRAANVRRLRSFEVIGNQVDPVSGLPAIRYTVDDRG